MNRRIGIGVLGCGTVGSSLLKAVSRKRAAIARATGLSLRAVRVCDREPERVRQWQQIAASDPLDVVRDPAVDVVVELLGGIEPACSLVKEAIRLGKPVVTANKALLSERGEELFDLARRHGVLLGFEASVAAAIPIIKSLRETFVANRIERLVAILNGTTNFILSRMEEETVSFQDALRRAQSLGYAEADPRLDISGTDAAHKLAILARYAFHTVVPVRGMCVQGIAAVDRIDIVSAREFGYTVKLLAVGRRVGNRLDVRVHPALLPLRHVLAGVRDVYNAVYLEGDLIGSSLLFGEGAGGPAAASSVLSDIVDVCLRPGAGPGMPASGGLRLMPSGEVVSRFYFRFSAVDRPGVLARISAVLGRHRISIASVTQKEACGDSAVPIVMVTHRAPLRSVRAALAAIDRLPVIKRPTVSMLIEE